MTSYPYNFGTDVFGWFCAFVVVVAASFFIVTGANDSAGAKPWHHAGALPPGVGQVTADSYFLTAKAKANPADICRESSTKSSSGIEVSTRVESLPDTTFLRCSRDQTWNDHRPRSINFGHAAIKTLTSPFWLGGVGALFFVLSIWPVSVLLLVHHGRALAAKERKREALASRKTYEKAKGALGAAWAQGKITDAEFEAKTVDLMNRYEVDD